MVVYTISEFAKKISVSISTLRRWDRIGALKAYRMPSNRRYYTEEQYINYCLKSGIPPDEIKIDKNKDSD